MTPHTPRSTLFRTLFSTLAVLALALSHQARADPEVWLQVAAGCVLAMGAGLFPLRVPGTRNSFTASDIGCAPVPKERRNRLG